MVGSIRIIRREYRTSNATKVVRRVSQRASFKKYAKIENRFGLGTSGLFYRLSRIIE